MEGEGGAGSVGGQKHPIEKEVSCGCPVDERAEGGSESGKAGRLLGGQPFRASRFRPMLRAKGGGANNCLAFCSGAALSEAKQRQIQRFRLDLPKPRLPRALAVAAPGSRTGYNAEVQWTVCMRKGTVICEGRGCPHPEDAAQRR